LILHEQEGNKFNSILDSLNREISEINKKYYKRKKKKIKQGIKDLNLLKEKYSNSNIKSINTSLESIVISEILNYLIKLEVNKSDKNLLKIDSFFTTQV